MATLQAVMYERSREGKWPELSKLEREVKIVVSFVAAGISELFVHTCSASLCRIATPFVNPGGV